MALLDDQTEKAVADLLEIVPAKSTADAERVLASLLQAGAPAIALLASLILEDGHGDDSKVRYAFHGLAIYSGRRDADRKLFAQAVSEELEKASPPLVKMFLMQQLYIAGAVEALPALKNLANDREIGTEAKRIISGLEQSGV